MHCDFRPEGNSVPQKFPGFSRTPGRSSVPSPWIGEGTMSITEENNDYYVYVYVRDEFHFGPPSPYYIGKGRRYRAYHGHKRVSIPEKHRIFIPFKNLTEKQALDKEVNLIKQYGRKDFSKGILRNMSDGGEGNPNFSEQTKQKLRDLNTGKNNPNYGLKRSEASRLKTSISMTGKKQSEKQKKAMSEYHGNTWFITNGTENKKIHRSKIIPEGWWRGTTRKNKLNDDIWINDGIRNYKLNPSLTLPEDCVRGFIYIKRKNIKTPEERMKISEGMRKKNSEASGSSLEKFLDQSSS